ncbi:protein nlrc3, partial [Chrysochromulina tobinii]
LPSLARLRWEGFTVNVAAVREVDLRTPRQEREFLGGRAKAALLSCIEGEGEPPLELLLAAVACAGSGEVRGIPVQMMRDDSVSELDLQDVIQDRNIGVEGGMLLAYLVPVMGALTSIDLSDNQLCGVRIDHRGRVRGTYTAEGIIAIADALRVNGALTSIKLRGNKLGDEGWGAIFAAICGNKDSKIMSMNAFWENIGPAGVKLIAEALRTSVTGALTSVDLRGNKLGDEGWGAIFAAICGNKDSKIMSMDVSGEDIGPAGVKLIAKALRTSVTGALTSVDLGGNELGDEGWGAIFAAICGNKDSKIMSMDASSENIGPAGVKLIAEALRTSVTGALTSVNLGGNELGDKGWGAIFAAICGNKDSKIMSMDVSGEDIGPDGVKLIAEALRTSVTGGLTSAKMLAEVAKQKGISLCGIQRDQTTADFSNQNLKPPDAILLESDLSQAVVTGALTSLDLSSNQLCGLEHFGSGTYTAEGITAIANALRVNGALMSVNLRDIQLGDKGWGAIFAAICGNKDSKITSLNTYYENIGPAGVKLITEALRTSVTGGLTVTDLLGNKL